MLNQTRWCIVCTSAVTSRRLSLVIYCPLPVDSRAMCRVSIRETAWRQQSLCMWWLAPQTWCESTAPVAWCPDTTNNCAISMLHNYWMAQSAGAVVSAMEQLQSTRTQTRAILRLLASLIANYSLLAHTLHHGVPGQALKYTLPFPAACPKCDHALSFLRVWLFPFLINVCWLAPESAQFVGVSPCWNECKHVFQLSQHTCHCHRNLSMSQWVSQSDGLLAPCRRDSV